MFRLSIRNFGFTLSLLSLLAFAACGGSVSLGVKGNTAEETAPTETPIPDETVPPADPSDLAADATLADPNTPAVRSIVNLTWKDNSDNEAVFVIERRGDTELDFSVLADNVPADSVAFTDENVPGLKYCYRILARNGAGDSARSEEACVDMLPAKPTGLHVTMGTQGTTIQWNDTSDNETGFMVGHVCSAPYEPQYALFDDFVGTNFAPTKTVTLFGLDPDPWCGIAVYSYNANGHVQLVKSDIITVY